MDVIGEKIPFFKLSGAGNDFLALVQPSLPPESATIRAWCRRALSLGADGLIVLEPADDGAKMSHYNPDGRESSLCLNGSRCAAQLAFELGWQQDQLRLETLAGTLEARQVDRTRVGLHLPPIATAPEPATLEAGGAAFETLLISVGVPHVVLRWPGNLAQVPVDSLGAELRSHPDLGPQGANVHFVRQVDRQRLEIRSYERGVEGETLACGTGAVAAAVAGTADELIDPPVTVLTAGGFELTIEGEVERGRLREIVLVGDARIVAEGKIFPEAATLPAPPAWS